MRKAYRQQTAYCEVTKQQLNRRIILVAAIFITGMLYMGVRVTAIKLQNGDAYQKQVLMRRAGQERQINPQRGNIVDRKHKIIAASTLSYQVILAPKDILKLETEQKERVYEVLSKHLGKSKENIKQFAETHPLSQYSIIMKKLSSEKMEVLKKEGLQGVWFEESFQRNYPKGSLAAQLIGFCNKDGNGQYGIEEQFDELLSGKPGRIFPQYQDNEILTTEMKPAENGATIVLTIDEVIQQYVELTMKKYIKEYHPINASAIIMNPSTGEIYSMFSYPEFNPNDYNRLENQLGKNEWRILDEKEKTQKLMNAWRNYNIQGAYEPGSTFKPLAVAASLDENTIGLDEKYFCSGSVTAAKGAAPIRCWNRSGHGEETLEEVLANSCNVGMIEMGSKMSSETFLKYMNEYGFGNVSHIQLPGEETGLLHSKLGPVEKATYSMGQGFTCTPIQLITAFSAVINGGYLLQPYVAAEAVDEKHDIIWQNSPIKRRQVISAETSQIVTHYLQKVVDTGTGVHAGITGYNIGGKTGTAEKLPRGNEKYILSFVGYAPIVNPQIIGLIVFDEVPEHSGAPTNAFKEMMLNILPYLGIELSLDETQQKKQMAEVPNVKNKTIYQASKLLNDRGLSYEIIGAGKNIFEQFPKAGTYLPKSLTVKLYAETKAPGSLVVVPDLKGLTLGEAKLLVGGTFDIAGTGEGKIVSQVPEAGFKIEKGTQIIAETGK